MIEWALGIVSVIVVILITVIINLLRKLENAEEYIEQLESSNSRYEAFFESIRKKSNNNYSYIRQLDRIGSFEADDETGVIFNTLKDIVEELNKEFDAAEED
jgi:competence protein ComGF